MNTTHKVGDTVHITAEDWPGHAGSYTVRKINPKTIVLDPVEGGRGAKVPHYYAKPGPLPEGGERISFTEVKTFEPGTVVKHARHPGQLYVVTGITFPNHRLFPLGGSDRYFRGVPGSVLTEVTEIEHWKKG
jgi:hypothetical protein